MRGAGQRRTRPRIRGGGLKIDWMARQLRLEAEDADAKARWEAEEADAKARREAEAAGLQTSTDSQAAPPPPPDAAEAAFDREVHDLSPFLRIWLCATLRTATPLLLTDGSVDSGNDRLLEARRARNAAGRGLRLLRGHPELCQHIWSFVAKPKTVLGAAARDRIGSARIAALQDEWAGGLTLTRLTTVVEDGPPADWDMIDSCEDTAEGKVFEGIDEYGDFMLSGLRTATSKSQEVNAEWTHADGSKLSVKYSYDESVIWRFVGWPTGMMRRCLGPKMSRVEHWAYEWEPDDTDYWGCGSLQAVCVIQYLTNDPETSRDIELVWRQASNDSETFEVESNEEVQGDWVAKCLALSCAACGFLKEINCDSDSDQADEILDNVDEVLKRMEQVPGVPDRIHGQAFAETFPKPDLRPTRRLREALFDAEGQVDVDEARAKKLARDARIAAARNE
jgi:hypothetical protein